MAGEKVQVRLEEVFKRIDHVLTKKEREEQEKWGRSWARKWEYDPTGLLRFRIEEYVEGMRKSWSDGGSQRLEEMLNDIVKGIVIVAEALRVRRLEREREERERREALERRAKLEQLRREEEARGRRGHFWERRYRSCLVEEDTYALAALRYLDRNPVRAGLVNDPMTYPWSSCAAYALGTPNRVLTLHP
ncbi:MAG TPA: hypothetical protein VJP78_02670, partial [Thermoleophilia bacterium]|nr:hypothetical protein [Thermoleophilia bacterium]